MLALFERNQNLAVGRTERHAIGERQIVAAVGQPDVVENVGQLLARDDAPNGFLHSGESLLGFFNARAAGAADVQADLPGVHLREEIRADQRIKQARRSRRTSDETDQHQLAMRQSRR